MDCTFPFNTSRVARRARLQKMKNWEPTLDEDGRPANYHHEIQRRLSTSRAPFSELEQILGHVVANAPGFLWHFGLRMNFKGSDCKGVWHKPAGNFGSDHCRFGHYIDKSFVHGNHQNWRRY